MLITISVPELQDDLRQKEALLRQGEAEVRQAQAAIRAAEAAAATAAAKVQEAQAGIERTEADIRRWKSEHARISELAGGGSVTRKVLDETLNQLQAAEASRREALARVESAKAGLNQSEANVASAQADEGAAVARQGVAEANLARAKTLLAYTQIRAPTTPLSRAAMSIRAITCSPPPARRLSRWRCCAAPTWCEIFVDVPELEAAMVDKDDAVTIIAASPRRQAM